jgi:hypothetical protein
MARYGKAELMVCLDVIPLFVKLCYDMEGDRLEALLLYDRVESLLATRRAIGTDGITPALDEHLRKTVKCGVGLKVKKH